MDPTANLEEQRRLAGVLLDDPAHPDFEAIAQRLADLVQALDEWIERGGFLPRSWNEARVAARDDERAVQEVISILKQQLDQGVENAARHIVACLDDLGR